MFPNDTLSVSAIVPVNTQTQLLPFGLYTLLYFRSSHQYATPVDILYCGDLPLITYSRTGNTNISTPDFLRFFCNNTVSYKNGAIAGGDVDDVLLNYVKYDLQTVPNFATSSIVSGNVNIANVSTTNGQIDGTILTNYFLFIIMCGLVFGFILRKFIYKK
jgi:thiamine pyrophosphokinase